MKQPVRPADSVTAAQAVPAPAPAPHQRSEDAVPDLDRQASLAMARLWHGLSPISWSLAYTDWLLHLAGSPGSRARLWRTAAEHGWNWWLDSARSAATVLAPAGQTDKTGAGEHHAPSSPEGFNHLLQQDLRFADPAWQRWPWRSLATSNKAVEDWWQQACSLRGMQAHSRDQMRFYGRQMLDMLSPSNCLLTNPQALQAAMGSGGQSLTKGLGQMLDAWRESQGLPAQNAPDEDLGPGRGLAMTPGQVVLRNELIELIQYTPTTAKVHAEPVLVIPSCIMKYYILDLSPHNSLVRWLVAQGHTVYMVSWHNPDESDALLGLDDYVSDGVLAALDHVHCATGEPVHLMGYCLGGTFAAMAAAALGGGDAPTCRPQGVPAAQGPLASLTLLAAETDFTEPGEMGVLIDEEQVRLLEDVMAATGYLTGRQMAGSFQFLHARELVWSSMNRRWLMGEEDVPNDLMLWNMDVTRLPAVMHSQYLRQFYLRNDLAEGRYAFEGRSISLRDIRVPVFGVGTLKDHVAPWRSCYKMHRLVSGSVTFVLTSGGHNAGIVSEPGHAGRDYQLLSTGPGESWRSPEEWEAAAPHHDGSWWTAWDAWLKRQGSGRNVTAREPRADPKLGPAPGHYVMVRYGD
ncbi:MAG TPA: alpha/beta fold hydrolase [Macromonas sp.]|nr:alpha/beta fold hydrolase [Macromonas sp.]